MWVLLIGRKSRAPLTHVNKLGGDLQPTAGAGKMRQTPGLY
jgi:hypothetical protein